MAQWPAASVALIRALMVNIATRAPAANMTKPARRSRPSPPAWTSPQAVLREVCDLEIRRVMYLRGAQPLLPDRPVEEAGQHHETRQSRADQLPHTPLPWS
jgi:hypothetical protein